METMENFMSNEHGISTTLQKGKKLSCQLLSMKLHNEQVSIWISCIAICSSNKKFTY